VASALWDNLVSPIPIDLIYTRYRRKVVPFVGGSTALAVDMALRPAGRAASVSVSWEG
jgi:hypothetical protein